MSEIDDLPTVTSTLSFGLAKFHGAELDCGIDLPGGDVASGDARETRSAALTSDCKRRYVLKDEIGRGGMGAVYRVVDTDLRRTLAMKVLLTKPAADGKLPPEMFTRFLEEAQVTGQLDHPGIVPLHELGMDENGKVYFTMRLVRGRHLGDVFKMARSGENGWSIERAVEALIKVSEAMAYAHMKGVVHRDLKPQNIMAGRFGEVYVMDWGLAKVQGRPTRRAESSGEATMSMVDTGRDRGSGITIAGTVFGTPAYMSPEQARGDMDAIDLRSDVYSLGAILYQLLAGHPPYVPPNATLSAATVLQSVLGSPPTPLSQVAPEASRDLVAICEKAMARVASERYPDMEAIACDLRCWIAGRPVSALPLSPVGRSLRWCRKNPWAAAALLAVSLGAVFGLWSLTGLNRSLVLHSARDAAAQEAMMLEQVNALYSTAVVARVDRAHVEVTHDYATKAGAIPLPATFLTELAAKISGVAGGVSVRHYSDYPFRFRGPAHLDDFGKQALASLRALPDTPVEVVGEIDDRPMLRYAVARKMGQSCVDCHNTHPESTKTDWKVGEVRGVLEIDRPLEEDEKRTRAGMSGVLTIMAALIVGLTGLAAVTLLRSARGERRKA